MSDSEDIFKQYQALGQEDQNKRGEQTAFERLMELHENRRGLIGKNRQLQVRVLDQGHDVLLRFVNDLQRYMGWPEGFWTLQKQNAKTFIVDDTYFPEPEAENETRLHTLKLSVTLKSDVAGIVTAEVDIDAERVAESNVVWMISIGKVQVGALDASLYLTSQTVLKQAATEIGRLLYTKLWM